MPTDRFVISHSGKKGGPWEAQDGVLGTPTTRISEAALVDREPRMLANIRGLHPSAKVFRLVRRSKPTLPTLERAVVEAAVLLVESNAAVVGGSGALTSLRTAVAALRAKRGW